MSTEQQPHKILVVDDEPDVEPLIRQRMRRDVRAGRYQFVFAHDGVEALEMLREHSDIDMVLSDINMPKMDGLTLLAQIPQVDPNLRCVIVSAYGDMDNIRTAMNRGAFDFVTKPLDFEDLKVTIERTLRRVAEWREALESRDRLVVLQNELDLASKMQQSILPTRFPGGTDFRIHGQMEPARAVGGDFFDIMKLDNGLVGVAIADVSDKGVPASLFMMSSRTLLKGAAVGRGAPGEVLQEVNNLLTEDNQGLMFVTVLYATFDPVTGAFTYANGGHNSPLLVRADGSSELLPLTGGVALGVMPDYPYAQSTMTLGPGEKLVMYTDGVTEAMNVAQEEFGVERLRAIFASGAPEGSRATSQAVFDAVHAFAGDTAQSDDVTCLVLSRGEFDT
ncbi:MAG: SpoIIE family protein phosphatase [Spirochaetaceae bacterium]|nr:SpoIIE family protein phosphatase [Spirochaetaceae bacterium]